MKSYGIIAQAVVLLSIYGNAAGMTVPERYPSENPAGETAGRKPPYGEGWRERMIDSLAHPEISEAGASMRFDAEMLDIGTIDEDGAPQAYSFSWTNTGDSPVTVLKVSTTCGCAAPSFDRVPVMPGESSSLKVTYYPKGHPGKFERRIFVYTDLSGAKPAAMLSLKGCVRPAVLPTWEYPVAMGPLLLRRGEVRITGDRIQTERILCLNAGTDTLHITALAEILPPCIKVWCEPERIAPGQKADIVVRFYPGEDGGLSERKLPEMFPVILEGISLPPSQRTIAVRTGEKKENY